MHLFFWSNFNLRWLRLSRPALWSLLNNSGLDGRGLSVCWNPDCRCRRLLPKYRRLPFSGFLPLDVSSPAVGDIFRSGRWRCVRCRGSFSKPFRHFTYITAHSPTLPSLYLHHNSFSNSSVASPTSQFILQTFFRFSYVTGSSLTSPGEPPMEIWIVRNNMKIKLVVTPHWNKPPLSLSQKWRGASTNAVNIIIERERERERERV